MYMHTACVRTHTMHLELHEYPCTVHAALLFIQISLFSLDIWECFSFIVSLKRESFQQHARQNLTEDKKITFHTHTHITSEDEDRYVLNGHLHLFNIHSAHFSCQK